MGRLGWVTVAVQAAQVAANLVGTWQKAKSVQKKKERAAYRDIKNTLHTMARQFRQVFDEAWDAVSSLLADLGFTPQEVSSEGGPVESVEAAYTGLPALAPIEPGEEVSVSPGAPDVPWLKPVDKWTPEDLAKTKLARDKLASLRDKVSPEDKPKLETIVKRMDEMVSMYEGGMSGLRRWWKKTRRRLKKKAKKVARRITNAARYTGVVGLVAHHAIKRAKSKKARARGRERARRAIREYRPRLDIVSLVAATDGVWIGQPATVTWDYYIQKAAALREALNPEGIDPIGIITGLRGQGLKVAYGRTKKDERDRKNTIRALADIAMWNWNQANGLVSYLENFISILERGRIPIIYKHAAVPIGTDDGFKKVGMVLPKVRKQAESEGIVCPLARLPVVEGKLPEEIPSFKEKQAEEGFSVEDKEGTLVREETGTAQDVSMVVSGGMPEETPPGNLYFYDETGTWTPAEEHAQKFPWWIIPVGVGGLGAVGGLVWWLRRRKHGGV
ncbi:MAG: hypothetical protein DRJ03_07330 [Chloroflexi bacterium]|nr:MAG: hypothetical protein DRJ03_07330 [Chloroflexota bacterium]